MPKHAKPRAIKPARPIVISPVPARSQGQVSRSISAKRVNRVRMSWFVVGSLFGVAVSFFMNLLVTAIVIPEYEQVVARHGGMVAIAEAGKPASSSPIARVRAAVAAVTPAAEETPVVIAAAPEPEPIIYPREVTLEVANGDTLIDMLIDNHVPTKEAHNVVDALKSKFNPRSLRIGQKISLTLARHETLGDAAAVKELAIKLPNLSTVELERLTNGSFNVASTMETLTAKPTRAVGKVRSSLSQAANDAGIGGGALAEITKAFSYDVDFQREIHPGDTLEVLLEKKVASDGRVGGYGDIRYAALTLLGKKHEIYRFKDNFGNVAWYDKNGNAVKKSLLRTPLNAARITSGFGMRRHPIMGYSKMHRGVDFGARSGTPIMAAGDGVVAFRGWRGGYGNYVQIQHNGTYSTAYGHMSRFANIRKGARVKQGQIIGYVGSTGQSTGPHLHYEVLARGAQVNPSAKQFNLASGLVGKQLATFQARKSAIAQELAALAKPAAPAKPQTVASR